MSEKIQLYRFNEEGQEVPLEPLITCADNLFSEDTDTPLSANQGKILSDAVKQKADFSLTTRDGCRIIELGGVVFITFNRYIAGSQSNEHILTSPLPEPISSDNPGIISMTYNGKPYEVFINEGTLIAKLCAEGETFGTDRIAGIFSYIKR